jgi:hypothetical protein
VRFADLGEYTRTFTNWAPSWWGSNLGFLQVNIVTG